MCAATPTLSKVRCTEKMAVMTDGPENEARLYVAGLSIAEILTAAGALDNAAPCSSLFSQRIRAWFSGKGGAVRSAGRGAITAGAEVGALAALVLAVGAAVAPLALLVFAAGADSGRSRSRAQSRARPRLRLGSCLFSRLAAC